MVTLGREQAESSIQRTCAAANDSDSDDAVDAVEEALSTEVDASAVEDSDPAWRT
jgi:hypothetical protein